MRRRLIALVLSPAPQVLSDREAALRLRPHGQGVTGAPRHAPENDTHPSAGNPGGVRGDQLLDRAGNITS